MPRSFDYTTQARSFALRYPLLTHISIQINFWVIGYGLLGTIMYLLTRSYIITYQLDIPNYYLPVLLSALVAGVFYGSILGLVDYAMEHRSSSRLALGRIILIRSIIYILVLSVLMVVLRYVVWEGILFRFVYDAAEFRFTEAGWQNMYLIFFMYSLVLSPGISFINQMNKKFGPGVLIPMLLGKYRIPIEQERLFMIMDLKSSTTIAENLGHRKYSLLIQDSFLDINEVLTKYDGEIYQYVGDEIVISWLETGEMNDAICLDFFYKCQEHFNDRKSYYDTTYGQTPVFKAGAHRGPVMAVEIGDIKREIAYHGDTINTTARIQSVCNEYNKLLLVSDKIVSSMSASGYHFHLEGNVELKGKSNPTPIFSVDSKE